MMKRVLCAAAGAVFGCAAAVNAAVIYVDDSATGANDGSSWANAFTDLQSALAAAQFGDDIWVAQGLYIPSRQADINDPTTTTGDPRDATFWIPRGVQVFGGFDGTEATFGDRAGLFSSTILSGDLGIASDPSDNSYRVVFYTSVHDNSSNQSIFGRLDGFVVEGANADTATGAGIVLSPGTISSFLVGPGFHVANCIVRDNLSSGSGAGLFSSGLSGSVMDTVFENNHAGANGGGMALNAPAHIPVIARCSFINNSAGGSGGGFARTSISLGTSYDLDMVSCFFSGNTSGSRGGGVWWATNGSGSSAELRLTNCVLTNNTADTFGGGLAVQGGASSPATILGSVAYVSSCTFADNSAGDAAGGAHAGEGAGTGPDAHLTVSNTIFWNNSADTDPQVNDGLTTVTIVYSCVEGGGTSFGNINTNPKFVDQAGGDYRILNGSPCADAGINSLIEPDRADLDGDSNTTEELPLDAFGNARRLDAAMADTGSGTAPIVDMGAHELCSADFDLDGDIDEKDMDAFLDAFTNDDPAADMNGDGELDFTDIALFLTAYNNGC